MNEQQKSYGEILHEAYGISKREWNCATSAAALAAQAVIAAFCERETEDGYRMIPENSALWHLESTRESPED